MVKLCTVCPLPKIVELVTRIEFAECRFTHDNGLAGRKCKPPTSITPGTIGRGVLILKWELTSSKLVLETIVSNDGI